MKILKSVQLTLQFISRHIQGSSGLISQHSSSSSTLFSGIQPTGVPHLGNYLGAIHHWYKLQEKEPDTRCIFSIVDLHSLTNPAGPAQRRTDILDTVIALLACGIDPNKSILFQQSDVSQHSELCWILTCFTTEARLKKVPQWKEKAKRLKNYSFGLIAYPVLMAADVMLYKATKVPVGEDQLQHLQLCRDLAQTFNCTYDMEFFPKCDWLLTETARIRNLRDPKTKMSKSDTSDKSRVNLDDSPEAIRLKIKQAVTDFTGKVYYDAGNRPGVSNLMSIHSALTGQSYAQIEHSSRDLDSGQYKLYLGDVVVEKLAPIRSEMARLRNDIPYIQSVLEKGSRQASEIGERTMNELRLIIGLK